MSGFVRLLVGACVISAFSACAVEDQAAYDDDWGADVLLGGKADGLLDTAAEVAYGQTVTGTVAGNALVLFRLPAREGDRFTVTMRTTSGDLNPHLQLFRGTGTFIDAADMRLADQEVTKDYRADSTADYALVARAFREEGEGTFSLTVTCTAGPCNGEFTEPETGLDPDDVNGCLAKTRHCAMERLPSLGTAVGPARARSLWNGCLAEQSTRDGESCASACERSSVCDFMVGELPFYADQSPACLDAFDHCMGTCYEAGRVDEDEAADDPFGDPMLPEEICLLGILGGTCSDWARETTACGGRIAAESRGECMSLCFTTDGAWIDDLDTICDESCGDCDETEARCAAECNGDESCEFECLELDVCA